MRISADPFALKLEEFDQAIGGLDSMSASLAIHGLGGWLEALNHCQRNLEM